VELIRGTSQNKKEIKEIKRVDGGHDNSNGDETEPTSKQPSSV
jgi:hypothetical protein